MFLISCAKLNMEKHATKKRGVHCMNTSLSCMKIRSIDQVLTTILGFKVLNC